MHHKKNVLIFSCLSLYLVASEKDLPPRFPKCFRDDPNFAECWIKASEQVRPELQKGIPELNVPPISPFYIPEVTLQQGTDTLSYKTSIRNLVLTGLDSYKITKFTFDEEKLYVTSELKMGLINLKGNYSLEGKLLSVPVVGNGFINANITSSTGTLKIRNKLVTKKGNNYLEPTETLIKIKVDGDVQTDYNGLFDGNEVLARAANNVIRENLQEVVHEVTPAVEEVFTRIMKDILLKGLYQIPYDKLYPVHKEKPS